MSEAAGNEPRLAIAKSADHNTAKQKDWLEMHLSGQPEAFLEVFDRLGGQLFSHASEQITSMDDLGLSPIDRGIAFMLLQAFAGGSRTKSLDRQLRFDPDTQHALGEDEAYLEIVANYKDLLRRSLHAQTVVEGVELRLQARTAFNAVRRARFRFLLGRFVAASQPGGTESPEDPPAVPPADPPTLPKPRPEPTPQPDQPHLPEPRHAPSEDVEDALRHDD